MVFSHQTFGYVALLLICTTTCALDLPSEGKLSAVVEELEVSTRALDAINTLSPATREDIHAGLSATKSCLSSSRDGACIASAKTNSRKDPPLGEATAATSANDSGKPARCSNVISSQLVKGVGDLQCNNPACPDGIGAGGIFMTNEGNTGFCEPWDGDGPATHQTHCRTTANAAAGGSRKDSVCTKAIIEHPNGRDNRAALVAVKRVVCTWKQDGSNQWYSYCTVFKTGTCIQITDYVFWWNADNKDWPLHNLYLAQDKMIAARKTFGAKLKALLVTYNNDLQAIHNAGHKCTSGRHPNGHEYEEKYSLNLLGLL